MKKLMTLALAGLLATSLMPAAHAKKAKKAKPVQTEAGQIVAPAPYTDDSGCYAGLHRRGAILTQGNNNGVIGWSFDVDPKTYNRPFKLEPSGGFGSVDMDITFYLADFGTIDDVAGDPLNAGAPPTIDFNTREAGGEAGKVPPMSKHAIICIYTGAQGQGGGANFTYNAG
ncbi:MAG TPA: hypothetical protein VFK89_00355 [Actinomycetota bacterium]|nr:hypothetical protein [Actinomycetota bacterium]